MFAAVELFINCSLFHTTDKKTTFFEEIKLPKLTNCHYSVIIRKNCNDRRIFYYSTLHFSKNRALLSCKSTVLSTEGAVEICFLKQNILETSRC